MTHYSVTVCLESATLCTVENRVSEILAPYDENMQVEPYREYEHDDAADFWFYRMLRRAAQDLQDGTGIKPYKPDGPSHSSETSRETPAEQRAKMEQDAALLATLPDPVTWGALVPAYNARYPDEDTPSLCLDEDGIRAFVMSRYNPDSKWDWWRIGGRWGGYYLYREEYEKDVISPVPDYDSPRTMRGCDGGPKRALDIGSQRELAAGEARELYRKVRATLDGVPPGVPWDYFRGLAEKEECTVEQARAAYWDQPAVAALRENKDLEGMLYGDDVFMRFSVTEDLYAERARARAMPGYALIRLDGSWLAPGEMGWFGMSSDGENDRIGYAEVANAYIESLPDNAWLVITDLHI